jgi:hypothetical protein
MSINFSKSEVIVFVSVMHELLFFTYVASMIFVNNSVLVNLACFIKITEVIQMLLCVLTVAHRNLEMWPPYVCHSRQFGQYTQCLFRWFIERKSTKRSCAFSLKYKH